MDLLKRSSYFYNLPEELIAQTPATVRDESRLLCLDKESGNTEHKVFHDIIDGLNPGDCLVINDTKVIPARLFGRAEGRAGDALFEPERLCRLFVLPAVRPKLQMSSL